MAKQTFTTGQVLTAAQMTSLQQTAMGGGSATAKTTSYVLVAADAGTTVAMNAAGATTITVNTGLFAAGDTVFIQNLGAGACTVTAGTATVASAGSLILPQYDAGILYFTATGAAIFYDYIQTGAASPLTTKGDVYTFSTSDARLGVGANNTILTADSAEATGLKWAAAASGGFTLIQRSSFSNVADTSTTFDGIFTSTYSSYLVIIENIYAATTADDLQFKLRYAGPTTQSTGYIGNTAKISQGGSQTITGQFDTNSFTIADETGNSGSPGSGEMFVNKVGNSSDNGSWRGQYMSSSSGDGYVFAGNQYTTRTYTGLLFKSSSSNITGTVAVYGLAK